MTTATQGLLEAAQFATINPIVSLPRMAAVLKTKDGKTHVGFNSKKTHPLAKRFGRNSQAICLHAEVDAIRKAIRSGSETFGSSLYVARILKNGTPAMAKPCPGCQRAIIAFGIKEVEWTT